LNLLHSVVGDEAAIAAAMPLVESEADLKYRKKDASVWKQQ